MATQYNMTDRLPKDMEGQKFGAPVDDSSSQLDFALFRAIGVETLGGTSRILGHLAVGSHTIGSAINNNAGMLLLGAYTEAPSALGTNNAQALRTDKEGALYVRPASGIVAFSNASTQTHVSGSLLLHGYSVYFSDVNVGDTVFIDDGTALRFPIIAAAASELHVRDFSAGVFFGTDIRHVGTFSGLGAASVTLIYSQY
jgi:hypothetical protein